MTKKKAINKKFRKTRYLNRYPGIDKKILLLLIDKDEFTYKDALIFRKFKKVRTKRYFKSNCHICKREFKMQIRTFVGRKTEECICNKCYFRKYVYDNPIWLEKNKSAQIIAQNKPETKNKNSISVKKYWKENPEKRKAMGRKISDRYQNDEKYRNAVTGSKYRGHINCRFGNIKFDSSLELCFIIQAISSKINELERWKFKGIDYINELNEPHRYYPDFVVNNKKIIEVKSWYFLRLHKNGLKYKIKATKKKHKKYKIEIHDERKIKCYNFNQICKMNLNIVFSIKRIQEKYQYLKEQYENQK